MQFQQSWDLVVGCFGCWWWAVSVVQVNSKASVACCLAQPPRSTPWIVAVASPSCNGSPPELLTGFCLEVGAGGDGTVMFCVCLARFLLNIKTANAQFAKPQTHILQSNRSVQSTAETSCPPCSVAVALMATGDASLFRDLCSNSVCLRTSRKPI